jgi:hypothetical protein
MTAMGSSFVELNEHGFWIADGLLETWLLLLVREIDAMPSRPEWLNEARRQWYFRATAGFAGLILPQLDVYVASPQQREQLIAISENVLDNLVKCNGQSEKDLSIAHWYGYGKSNITLNLFLKEVSEIGQTNLVKLAKAFIKLLRGEVTQRLSASESGYWINAI